MPQEEYVKRYRTEGINARPLFFAKSKCWCTISGSKTSIAYSPCLSSGTAILVLRSMDTVWPGSKENYQCPTEYEISSISIKDLINIHSQAFLSVCHTEIH